MNTLENLVIGLASKSPRRKFLMEESGFKIELIDSPGEEIYPQELSIYEVPAYLSTQKALNALPNAQHLSWVLAADTVVIQDQSILGKPKDRDDCLKTLKNLSSRSHEVITGVTILYPPFKKIFSVKSIVEIGNMDDEELAYYVDHYAPFDKAGSYGIQEWLGYCKVKHIEGSYTNVMGLPMFEVYHALKDLLSATPN